MANGGRGSHRSLALGGLALIIVGAIFLLRNLGYPFPRNWWALFFLIPIAGVFGNAWRVHGREGRVTGEVAGSLMIGVLLVALAVVFLLDISLNWNLLWPVILIVVGIGVLAGRAGGHRSRGPARSASGRKPDRRVQ
jgi:asparagine N-glycosylation enzyme membrane subunit Stt3